MIAVRAEATATAEERERFEAVFRARYGELYSLSFRLLGDHGFRTIEAGNGREAIDLMHRERPSAVILDLMMPVMSGFDVLEERATDPELRRIPVIVVSANRAPEIATAVDKGICAFLPKPFDINVLNALVRSCLASEPTNGTATG